MPADPLADVPAARGAERRTRAVFDARGTARDRRWQRHFARGSLAAGAFIFAGVSTGGWYWVSAAVAVAWWATGVLGSLRHSVRMGWALSFPVEVGMDVWRALPPALREQARPVADGLIAAGRRHNLGGVRMRLSVLNDAARVAQGPVYPGYQLDAEELRAFLAALHLQELQRD